jgi:hypothetical protein
MATGILGVSTVRSTAYRMAQRNRHRRPTSRVRREVDDRGVTWYVVEYDL